MWRQLSPRALLPVKGLSPRGENPAHLSEQRFNGATAFRRWKLLSCRRRLSRRRGFNGATALWRWKPGSSWVYTLALGLLQWGHRISTMESLGGARVLAPGVKAAMGPPPFGDGKWKDGTTWQVAHIMLQWGHRLSAMERRRGRHPRRLAGEASMGPPPFGDGKGHLYRRDGTRFTTLQWGHRLSAMESSMLRSYMSLVRELQWGHRLSAMESCPGPRATGRSPRFNGATAFRRWKECSAASKAR